MPILSMYNMTEVDNIIRVERNNGCVQMCDNSKKMYERECKKMDDLLIQYHQLDNIGEKNDFYLKIVTQRLNVVNFYEDMMSTIRIWGNLVFDPSMMQKNKLTIINEELIQKAMSPARLTRHLGVTLMTFDCLIEIEPSTKSARVIQ